MTTSHQSLGFVVAGLSIALVIAGGWSVVGGARTGGRIDHRFAVDRLLLVVLAVIGLALASGLVLLAADHGPADALHFVYAVVAIAIVPIGYVAGTKLARPDSGRLRDQRDVWAVVTGIVLLAIAARLVATG